MNKYGIICAMELEAEHLLLNATVIGRETGLGMVFHDVLICGTPCVVAVSGIGKVLAAAAAQHLIDRFSVSSVINIGVAGALSKELCVGDIVVASRLVQHDLDTTPVGDPPGWISEIGGVDISASSELAERILSAANEQALPCTLGAIATGDRFVVSPEEKERIRKNFVGADGASPVACEMEGAAVALVCRMNGIPCGVMRCISDGAGEAMEYERFKFYAAERSSRVLLRMLANT